MKAPDSHLVYLLDGTVDYSLDQDEIYIRSLAGQIDLVARQRAYTLMGYERYIYYWSENREFAEGPDEVDTPTDDVLE